MKRSWLLVLLFLTPFFLSACTCSSNQKKPVLRSLASNEVLQKAYLNEYSAGDWDVVQSQEGDFNGDKKEEALLVFLSKNGRELQLVIYDKKEEAYARVAFHQVHVLPAPREGEESQKRLNLISVTTEDVTGDKIPETVLHYNILVRDQVVEEWRGFYQFQDGSVRQVFLGQIFFKPLKGERSGNISFETLKNGRIVLKMKVKSSITGEPPEKTRQYLWHSPTGRFEEVITIRQENE